MTSQPQHAPPTVLLVDDDPLVRMIGAEFLERAGFEVLEAADADEANVVLEARRDVRALVTDVQMPGSLDGFDLAHQTRRTRPRIALIVMSAKRGPETDSLPEGAVFMPKPINPSAMVSQVQIMIQAAARGEKQTAGVNAGWIERVAATLRKKRPPPT